MAPSRKAVDLFLSLGVTASLGCSAIGLPPQAQAQAQHHHPVAAQANAAEGGEGGEGGDGGSSAAATLASDVDLLVVLAQMQGHLRIAQELLAQGRPQAAEPHTGHPVDELYGAAEPALQQRGIAPFLQSLETLRQQVRLNPTSPAVNQDLARAQQAITAAAEALPPAVLRNPDTTMAVVRQLAAAAVSEYDGAVANGRIAEVIEYQDARGFLLEGRQLLTTAMGTVPATSKAALETRAGVIEAMLKAFPTAMPPSRVVVSLAQLQQLHSKL